MYRTTKTEDTEAFVRQRGKPRKTKTQSNLPAWHDKQICKVVTICQITHELIKTTTALYFWKMSPVKLTDLKPDKPLLFLVSTTYKSEIRQKHKQLSNTGTEMQPSYCTSATRCRSGSSQCMLHSQWLSRNVNTGAVATSAPRTRDLIKPSSTHTAYGIRGHDMTLVSRDGSIYPKYCRYSADIDISVSHWHFRYQFFWYIDIVSVTSEILLSYFSLIFNVLLLLVCVSLTIIGQPRNSVFIRRV